MATYLWNGQTDYFNLPSIVYGAFHRSLWAFAWFLSRPFDAHSEFVLSLYYANTRQTDLPIISLASAADIICDQ
ncbi:hypothetical protein QR98_0056370 [Sarcoptes scabiei]|uniref:Uncharacterized protein n=1 Tax=Sarcoptes scabiei TaxID=52283 RepID=A0A132A855_SARSC|nr:hypothetical protein QR98_0056370 [Sarcoptes scabiei]